MEFCKRAYAFASNHSKVIFTTVVSTAFFSDGKNFVLEPNTSIIFSQLNLALLAVARSILCLIILFIMQQVFITKTRRTHFNTDPPFTDLVLDTLSVAVVFLSPLRVLKSVLVLVQFGIPFSILLLVVGKLVEYLQGLHSDMELTPPPKTLGLRTRSGMFVPTSSIEDEIRRLRQESMTKRSSQPSPVRKTTPRSTKSSSTNKKKIV